MVIQCNNAVLAQLYKDNPEFKDRNNFMGLRWSFQYNGVSFKPWPADRVIGKYLPEIEKTAGRSPKRDTTKSPLLDTNMITDSNATADTITLATRDIDKTVRKQKILFDDLGATDEMTAANLNALASVDAGSFADTTSIRDKVVLAYSPQGLLHLDSLIKPQHIQKSDVELTGNTFNSYTLRIGSMTVSYTHLTLPTILLV